MSLVRGNSYTRAGVGTIEQDKFEVNKSVFILDATAGRGYDAYDDRLYPAEHTARRENSSGLTAGMVCRVFGVLVLALLLMYVINEVHIRKLAYEVSVMEEHVNALSETNAKLDRQLLSAREITQISLNASRMGMVLMEDQEVHYVTAPDTRPFAVRGETKNGNP